jgi:predicted RNase H-like nuclease (RuvC/YqgF family)
MTSLTKAGAAAQNMFGVLNHMDDRDPLLWNAVAEAAISAEREEPVRCGVHDVSLERDGEYHGDCVACRLESERAGLEQERDALRVVSKAARERNERLCSELAAVKEERNELQDAVDGLQETLDRSREEWATAMEREIGRRETELSTLRQRCAELEKTPLVRRVGASHIINDARKAWPDVLEFSRDGGKTWTF